MTPSPPPPRYAGLDAVRGVAVLWTALFHYTARYHQIYGSRGRPTIEINTGDYSVRLFFIVSGFVIPLAIASSRGAGQFVFRRVARLYPAFWTCAAITFAAVAVWGLPRRTTSPQDAVINLTMVPGWFGARFVDGAYWSMAVQVAFYAVMAALTACGQIRRAALVFMGLAAVYTASVHLHVMPALRSWRFAEFAHLFAIGILIYHWRTEGRRTWHGWAFAALSVACYVDRGAVYVIWIALLCGLMALAISRRARLERATLLVWIGRLSFPLYLVHQNVGFIVLRAADARGINGYVGIALAFGVAFGLAYVVHRFVEDPSIAWAKRRRMLFSAPWWAPDSRIS